METNSHLSFGKINKQMFQLRFVVKSDFKKKTMATDFFSYLFLARV